MRVRNREVPSGARVRGFGGAGARRRRRPGASAADQAREQRHDA